MEAAPSAKPRRDPPPIPPHYVSLRKLQELRLKEQEEKRRQEEEEAAAAAAKREAEAAAMAAAIKRDAALKEAPKGRAVSWEGSKERHRWGQGHQWVPLAHRAPAATPRPTPTCGEVAAVDRGRAVGGGRGKKGPGEGDVADSAPHGGCKALWKGKGKASSCPTVDEAGKLAEAAPASSNAGKPEDKGKARAKGKTSGDQTAQSRSSGGPGEPAAASSRDHCRRKGRKGARTGDAPAKSAGPRGVKLDNTGKPKPSAPSRADSGTASDSPDGKKAAPAQAPPTSAADGSSKSTGDGELRKNVEAKPEGLMEGQRRRPAVEVQTVAELKPRAARMWAEPRRDRGIEAAEQHGRVWVPKAAAAATASSAGAGL
ncbi:hypothetical protein BS78_01G118200 [Paspalum vaginatum]|nr:hypothetical protein BS78_01G118200 [Paspalum vaginatum]